MRGCVCVHVWVQEILLRRASGGPPGKAEVNATLVKIACIRSSHSLVYDADIIVQNSKD
jgi:hypothetical protein